MFRDEAIIEVIAGKGGDGLISFRREKYVAFGGPDGGDGGDGGSVILVANPQVTSLLRIGRQFRYAARGGQPGGPRKCTGKGGADVRIEVPVGTQVLDAAHGNMLKDLCEPGMELVVAQGGRGGKGNPRFANAVVQVPRKATKGTEGEHRRIKLELKLFAQVGLLGFPNAGKSTFLSRVTAAKPKIADYPFTTLIPQVGIAELPDYETLVIADLPGLIEGAAEGHGLGHRFLKHVERCKVLIHLVDVSTMAERDPVEAWAALEEELLRASPDLHSRARLVVASKHFEDEESGPRLAELERAAGAVGQRVLPISSVLGLGLKEVLLAAREMVYGAESAH
ncbi:MAG: GTPase ObgE [Planctomycetes bacterium]|nr:GTPase ObgE [Planctomycetota bacterium]MCB9910412.1 GTPase ObgE [Planctomycetota bacterium]HPF14905.1 GTPase ObgE [Planctomycetota bacterium]HRV81756.1 GTPase ObgE [Planctomycetota bacterium]